MAEEILGVWHNCPMAIEPGPQFSGNNDDEINKEIGIPKSDENDMELRALKGHLSTPEMQGRLAKFLLSRNDPEERARRQERMSSPDMMRNKSNLAQTMRDMGIETPWDN